MIQYLSQYKCHDMIHDMVHHYIQLTGEEELQRTDEPSVLSVGASDCVSWQLIGTAHAFVWPSWKIRDLSKAIQSEDGTFFPFARSLCLINSSKRAWTWVRSHKRQLFLNDEFFIHEELQYHTCNIMTSCRNIDICIVTKNIVIH